MNKEHCPFCGNKTYYHQVKPMTLNYKKEKKITLDQPGYWCDSCKEGVIGGQDRKATQKQLQAFRAKVDGLLSPDEIKKIRKKLKLSQKQASVLFGGGVNAFSRYEQGEIAIYRATSQLLKILDKHPEQLCEIVENKSVSQKQNTNKGAIHDMHSKKKLLGARKRNSSQKRSHKKLAA
ncbi:MAG: type II toxin-antitoxin system MqsA family antitoxin [Proteobacteria bacterium]|nr:type II toxin-antitoxin system MqsA family antitoxin [Pseudomonadota bacterium]